MSKLITVHQEISQHNMPWVISFHESWWNDFRFLDCTDDPYVTYNNLSVREEVLSWLNEHFEKKSWYFGVDTDELLDVGHYKVRFFFRNESDTTLFLLRWAGQVEST